MSLFEEVVGGEELGIEGNQVVGLAESHLAVGYHLAVYLNFEDVQLQHLLQRGPTHLAVRTLFEQEGCTTLGLSQSLFFSMATSGLISIVNKLNDGGPLRQVEDSLAGGG